MKLFASLVLVFSFANSAFADYNCNDISYLQKTLFDLERSCSIHPGPGPTPGPTPPPGVCRAKGYIGNSPTEAVANCSAPGTPYSAQSCGSDLTCPASFQYCRANGYIGNTPTEAIANCSAPGTPYSAQSCGNALSCNGDRLGYFNANGYIGDTPEQAIQNCAAPGTPYSTETCSGAVKCVGSQWFCQNWTLTLKAFQTLNLKN